MKSFLFTFVLFGSSFAFAGRIECVQRTKDFTERVIVAGDAPTAITVEVNGRAIYSNVAVAVDYQSGTTTYASPTFKNKNRAPSSLYFKTFMLNGKFMGDFFEVSYLPLVPPLYAECRGLN